MMKKTLCLILTLFTVLSALALPSFALDGAVYLKDGGAGDGSSAASPLGALADAYAALGNDGGTIIICGVCTMSETFSAPSHAGEIRLTSVYGGTDYRAAGAMLYSSAATYRYIPGGATVFGDINIKIGGTSWVIPANYNPITMDEGVTFIKSDGSVLTSENISKSPALLIYLLGGAQADSSTSGVIATARNLDSNIIIRSGVYHIVGGGSRQAKGTENFTGTANIRFEGGFIRNLDGGQIQGTRSGGDVNIVMTGGRIGSWICAAGATATTNAVGTARVWLLGGEFAEGAYITARDTAKSYLYHTAALDGKIGSSGVDFEISTEVINCTLALPDGVAAGDIDEVIVGGAAGEIRTPVIPDGDCIRVAVAAGGESVQINTADGESFVWLVAADGSAERLTALDNLAAFVGSSIRVTGTPGLRFKYSVPTAVGGAGLSGYTADEYGVVVKAAANETPLSYIPSNYADGIGRSLSYGDGGNINCVFARSEDRTVFTAVLVGIYSTHYETAFVARGFCKLSNGEDTVYLYAPLIEQSLRGVANLVLADPNNMLDGAGLEYVTHIASGTSNVTPNAISALNLSATDGSHAEAASYAAVELDFRTRTELSKTTTTYARYEKAFYPRIKQMSDGRYIMFYQYSQLGQHIYYTTSDDLLTWTSPQVLVRSADYIFDCDYTESGTDRTYWMTPDADVLENGDILVAVSFRATAGYSTHPELNGIATFRSTNNGASFSGPTTVYVGTNWEPMIKQLSNGDVHIYFTHIAPKIALYGFNSDRRSSGVAMIKSSDNGATWTPNVTSSPYAATRVMQRYALDIGGVKYFTDQMPSMCELYNGKLALAAEGYINSGDEYTICIARSGADGVWTTLGIDEEGPADRDNDVTLGAAPYLARFESGEVLLSYNKGPFFLRVGDANAENFGAEYSVFPGIGGCWGATEIINSHSAVVTYAQTYGTAVANSNSIFVGRVYLNHAIDAGAMTPAVNGDNDDWTNNTDALFVGSETQAQISVRFAYDTTNVYLLAERLDDNLTAADTATVYIGAGGDRYALTLATSGISMTKNGAAANTSALACGIEINGLVDGVADDVGIVHEVKIPKSALGLAAGDSITVNVALDNNDGGDTVTDTIIGTSTDSAAEWIPVRLG